MKLFQDWNRNTCNFKGQLILLMFRVASISKNSKLLFIVFLPYLIIYRLFVEWILGVELPYKTSVGNGLIIYHGHALVINDGSIIGNNCVLRHCTTIGNKRNMDGTYSKCPTIGDNVDVGTNVCIIGPITIGNNVIIGAGSVVINDIPSNSIVVGNPARVIRAIS